jgi:hypothetical protein
MPTALDKNETRKDTLQFLIESGATHVGSIMGIVVGSVRDVTRELGDFATDVFEIRDATHRARADAQLGPNSGPKVSESRRPQGRSQVRI